MRREKFPTKNPGPNKHFSIPRGRFYSSLLFSENCSCKWGVPVLTLFLKQSRVLVFCSCLGVKSKLLDFPWCLKEFIVFVCCLFVPSPHPEALYSEHGPLFFSFCLICGPWQFTLLRFQLFVTLYKISCFFFFLQGFLGILICYTAENISFSNYVW